ncbi:15820_t:CDS:1, partial [Rhizophagus irregularis]
QFFNSDFFCYTVNQPSLNAANEEANLNQLKVSASTTQNDSANFYDSDQANALFVSKRNVIPGTGSSITPYLTFNRVNNLVAGRDSFVNAFGF